MMACCTCSRCRARIRSPLSLDIVASTYCDRACSLECVRVLRTACGTRWFFRRDAAASGSFRDLAQLLVGAFFFLFVHGLFFFWFVGVRVRGVVVRLGVSRVSSVGRRVTLACHRSLVLVLIYYVCTLFVVCLSTCLLRAASVRHSVRCGFCRMCASCFVAVRVCSRCLLVWLLRRPVQHSFLASPLLLFFGSLLAFGSFAGFAFLSASAACFCFFVFGPCDLDEQRVAIAILFHGRPPLSPSRPEPLSPWESSLAPTTSGKDLFVLFAVLLLGNRPCDGCHLLLGIVPCHGCHPKRWNWARPSGVPHPSVAVASPVSWRQV